MSLTRDSINWMLGESADGRFGGMPVDPTEAIYQGDALVWDSSNKVATKAGPSASEFLGISETKNPIATLGSPELLGNLTDSKVNVIQSGLVKRIAEHAMTLYPFAKLTVGSDAQKVSNTWATNATECYVVDPKWATAAGKVVAAGDEVRCWIKVRPAYALRTPASAALA